MRWLLIIVALVRLAHADSECAAPATCRPACDKGDVSACAWLGEFYFDGAGQVPSSPMFSTAVGILQGACNKGSAEACAVLAEALHRTAIETGSTADDQRIAQLRQAACKNGQGDACDNDAATRAAYEHACAASRGSACIAASRWYEPEGTTHPEEADDPPPPPPDDEDARAAGIVRKRSTSEVAKGKKLRARGLALLRDACAKGGARSCAELPGHQPADLDRACKAGASKSCRELAFADISLEELTRTTALDPKRSAAFATYSTRGCELGDFGACEELADAYETGNYGLKPDAAKAEALNGKACEAQEPAACMLLGKRAKDPARALAMFQRACDLRAGIGCAMAGDAYKTKDRAKAIALYAQACDLEDRELALFRPVCAEAASIVDDPAKATALRAQGCARGEKRSCASP